MHITDTFRVQSLFQLSPFRQRFGRSVAFVCLGVCMCLGRGWLGEWLTNTCSHKICFVHSHKCSHNSLISWKRFVFSNVYVCERDWQSLSRQLITTSGQFKKLGIYFSYMTKRFQKKEMHKLLVGSDPYWTALHACYTDIEQSANKMHQTFHICRWSS